MGRLGISLGVIVSVVILFGVINGNEESGSNHRKSYFDELPTSQKTFLKHIHEEFENLIASTKKCIEDEIKGFSCNFNATFDRYALLDSCTKNTGLNDVIHRFVDSIPASEFDYAVPPSVTKDRCYKFPGILSDLPPLSKLIPKVEITDDGNLRIF